MTDERYYIWRVTIPKVYTLAEMPFNRNPFITHQPNTLFPLGIFGLKYKVQGFFVYNRKNIPKDYIITPLESTVVYSFLTNKITPTFFAYRLVCCHVSSILGLNVQTGLVVFAQPPNAIELRRLRAGKTTPVIIQLCQQIMLQKMPG
jgi:hypothetical protein